MGLLFEKLKARQKPDGTFTPAPAEDTPMLSGSLLNVPRPEYSDKVEVELVSQTTIKPQTIYDIVPSILVLLTKMIYRKARIF